MLARKPSPESTDVRAVLGALDRRVVELQTRDRELLQLQLDLEKRSAAPIEPRPATGQSDASEMLESGKVVTLIRTGDGERLWEILRERRVIGEAIKLAGERGFRLRVANQAELAGDIESAWRQNILKSAAAVRALRELASERARLIDEYVARTGLPFEMPCGQAADRVVGQSGRADTAQAFLESAQRAQFI